MQMRAIGISHQPLVGQEILRLPQNPVTLICWTLLARRSHATKVDTIDSPGLTTRIRDGAAWKTTVGSHRAVEAT
jgi:hypothetical protein